MKLTLVGVVSSLGAFAFVAPVLAGNIGMADASGFVQALDGIHPSNGLFKNFQDSDTDLQHAKATGNVTGTQLLFGCTSGTCGTNTGTGSASADSKPGLIGVSAEADGTADSNIRVEATASATYTDDNFRFTVPSRPGFVSRVIITAPIDLVGDLLATGAGDITFDNFASVRATVTATQSGQVIGLAVSNGSEAFTTEGITERPFGGSLQLQMVNVQPGLPVNLSIHLEASARVFMTVTNNRRGPGQGNASSLFTHTLRWGGITSVVDSLTGEPIEGWVVTADSGFDYSKPAGVPEPNSLVLVATAILTTHLSRSGRGPRRMRSI